MNSAKTNTPHALNAPLSVLDDLADTLRQLEAA